LIAAVERGEAPADIFVNALREGPVKANDFTPRAVANYLEALACEKMLCVVPAEFADSPDILLSYETVFEDMHNVFNNWEAYKAFLRCAYGVDLSVNKSHPKQKII
jgi:hypothetical protein